MVHPGDYERTKFNISLFKVECEAIYMLISLITDSL